MLGAFDHLGPTNQMITANHTALLRRQQPATSIQRFNQLWKRYEKLICGGFHRHFIGSEAIQHCGSLSTHIDSHLWKCG
jgi:hypothetical protein